MSSNVMLNQSYQFLVYVVSGIIISIIFDVFRISRKIFKTSDFVTYIEDILFWIITGIFLLYVLFKFSNGEIRFYTILGVLIGSITYFLSISKLFINISTKIFQFIKNTVYKILKIIVFPVKIILKVLKKTLKKLFKPFTFFVINLKKILFRNNKKTKNTKKIISKRRILKRNVEKNK